MARVVLVLGVAGALAWGAGEASAQSLGTFRWQLEPFCNVVTVTITQNGSLYRVEGTDEQCGGGRDRASVLGMAFPNPDGTIGFGMTIVTAPGGVPVHVDAEITVTTLSGTWRDSAGNAGAFAFTPGAGTGGSPRPRPTLLPPNVAIAADGSILAQGNGAGAIPATGPGTRMMWYPGKAAFRAGSVDSTNWDDFLIGTGSTAFGRNTMAAGPFSFAAGDGARADGNASIALGSFAAAAGGGVALGTRALAGASSFAAGRDTQATGFGSTALGENTIASQTNSTALGVGTRASSLHSLATGKDTVASGPGSTTLGSGTTASGSYSLAGGINSTARGPFSLAFGSSVSASGSNSVALGTGATTTAAAEGSFVFADVSSQNPFTSFVKNQFIVRAAGGLGVYTNAATTTGAEMAPGGGAWAALSDASMKENFTDVDGEDVLARLARVPVREWNYTSQDASVRHLGPTAQDFRAAFGLGEYERRITSTDADGVALAAVKALDARTRWQGERIEALERQLVEALAALEALRPGAR